ncbi:MAG: hypothetical protein ACKO7W_03130, partial [Elainella sp.]
SPDDLQALLQQTGYGAGGATLPAGLTLPSLADLADLQGRFSALATLRSGPDGLQTALTLQGEDWRLADYGIGQLSITNAQYDGRSLTLPAVQASGFSLALAGRPQAFAGQFGFTGQATSEALQGQLQLNQIALPQIQQAFDLPVTMQGQVHANAVLSGRPSQPHLVGELHLDQVNIQDRAIEATQVGFRYADQKFQLESWQAIPGSQPAAP